MKQLWSRLPPLPWRDLCAAAPAMLLMGVALHYYADFVSDDAYISFRYAEHLATGLGLQWNPGYRVEGFSNLMWVLLLGALRWLGLLVPDAARVLVWLSCLTTVLLVVGVARRQVRRPAWLLLALSPLPMVLSFPYQYWAAMRLETAFFSMLLLLAPLLFLAEERRWRRGQRWPSALVYLVLAMTRPEGAVFLALPGVYLLCRLRRLADLRLLLRERGLWLLLVVVGLLGYEAWRLAYFGEWLPNTYYAKVGTAGDLERGWNYLVRFITERPLHLVLVAAPLLLGAASSAAGAMLLGSVVTLATVVVLEGGDWMREWRLLMPATPLATAALALALQRAWPRQTPKARLGSVAGLLLLALGVHLTMGTPWAEYKLAAEGKQRDQLINLEGEMTRVSAQVGRWLRARARPRDLVAVNHAGAVPFYSGLPTIDMVGLNDHHIARRPGARHGKWDANYVMARKPRYLVLNTRLEPSDGQYVPGYWSGETALARHPDFARYYRSAPTYWAWRHADIASRASPAVATAYIMVFERQEGRYRKLGPCLGFESGTYRGWTLVRGQAFGKAPATGPMGSQRAEGFAGRYLANSYPATDLPGGLLRSDPFTLRGNRLDFRVGGGSDPAKVGVRLVVDGDIKFTANGRRDGRLRPTTWDTSELRGRQARLEIYDNGPGPWGHVLADEFCQFEAREPAGAATFTLAGQE